MTRDHVNGSAGVVAEALSLRVSAFALVVRKSHAALPALVEQRAFWAKADGRDLTGPIIRWAVPRA